MPAERADNGQDRAGAKRNAEKTVDQIPNGFGPDLRTLFSGEFIDDGTPETRRPTAAVKLAQGLYSFRGR